jgi:hypothetical protein
MFAWSAGEFVCAWAIASYIDAVAAAGKAVYDLPMFANAAKMEIHKVVKRWMIAGETYFFRRRSQQGDRYLQVGHAAPGLHRAGYQVHQC